jgi:PEP-CTERM motif
MAGIAELVALGEFGTPTFQPPGEHLQIFEVEFEGTFAGLLKLTFAYDAGLLTAGFDEDELHVFHWIDDEWVDLGGTVDSTNHTITAYTDALSPFAIAAVPEPESYAMMLAGLGLVGAMVRRRKQAQA